MSQLQVFYWICSGLGFFYITGSALLGHMHGAEDVEGGDPGDVDAGDGGDPGDVDAGDVDAGEVDAGDGGDPGDVDASAADTDTSNTNLRLVHHNAAAGQIIATKKARQNSHGLYFKLLGLLSPTKLAVFFFCFGAFGIISLTFLPFIGHLSLLPAAVLGYGSGQLMLNIISRIVGNLHSSTNYKKESLIGSTGELVISIEPGRIGEVVIATRGSRQNAPARAKDPEQSIDKLTKVIVCDRKDGVFLVEPAPQDMD